jgi:hypothetical protein
VGRSGALNPFRQQHANNRARCRFLAFAVREVAQRASEGLWNPSRTRSRAAMFSMS